MLLNAIHTSGRIAMLPIHEPEECFFGTVAFFRCVIKHTAMAAILALKGILSRLVQ